jgi:two-component system, cell cycle sensor histidine kinase and response regulator CckA
MKSRVPSPARRHEPERILLVDDHAGIRGLVKAMLIAGGYEVVEAADGAEAIRLAEEPSAGIGLLMTDVVMPGMNGWELAQTFRARCPEVRVLFISGYTKDVIARHGGATEDVAFLQKPFTPSLLAAKIREVLTPPCRPFCDPVLEEGS